MVQKKILGIDLSQSHKVVEHERDFLRSSGPTQTRPPRPRCPSLCSDSFPKSPSQGTGLFTSPF